MKHVWSSAVALGILAVAPLAAGQSQVRAAGAQTAQTPDVMPVPTTGASGPGANAGDANPPPPKPVVPAAGYAYSDKAASTGHAAQGRYRRSGPVVQLPGFEQTADGGSRLFVQLSQNVPVEERKAQGSVTYVLKGASPRVRNNTNALVTVHFNTPVSRARLVPHGADLHFVIDLRAAATPTWKMVDAPDKTSMLQVDFPKGDYLPTAPATAEDASSTPPPEGEAGEEGPVRSAGPRKTPRRGPAPRGAPAKKTR